MGTFSHVERYRERPYQYQSTGWLIREAGHDARDLAAQEIRLVIAEARRELAEQKKALLGASIAWGALLSASILLGFAGAEVLVWAGLPRAVGYGIVGLVLVLMGMSALGFSRSRARRASLPLTAAGQRGTNHGSAST
jgi:hypothetical protein